MTVINGSKRPSVPSLTQNLAVRLGTLSGSERLALAEMILDNFQVVNLGHFSALLQARMRHQLEDEGDRA